MRYCRRASGLYAPEEGPSIPWPRIKGAREWMDAASIGTLVGAKPPGFLPSDLSGLIVWLRADAIMGLNDGDAVSTWSNEGSEGDATEATNPPIYKVNIQNGLPVVRYDGTNDVLKIANSDGLEAGNLTAFVAFSIDTSNTGNVVIGHAHALTHSDPYFRWVIFWQNASSDFQIRINGSVASSGNVASGPFAIWELHAGDGDGLINGAVVVNSTGATLTYPSNTPFLIGANVVGGENHLGDFGEIIVYNSNLSGADRTSVRAYLTNKWAIV